MQVTPIIDTPFSRISIDVVGPVKTSSTGCRFILTIVDHATRWPDAYPIKDHTAPTVSTALLTYFSRMGFPKEILSDRSFRVHW